MSDPQYGTQTVRFVETAQVADTGTIDQFRVCQRVGTDNSTTIKNTTLIPTSGLTNSANKLPNQKIKVLGVTQQRLRAVNGGGPSEENASDGLRLVSVATSGLLLIEQAPTNALNVGDPLSVDTNGRASKEASTSDNINPAPAALVTVNGTTPTVRSVVPYGKKHYALVSFT